MSVIRFPARTAAAIFVREMPGDVLVETRLCEGPEGEAIVAACDEDVDLLVCGLPGRPLNADTTKKIPKLVAVLAPSDRRVASLAAEGMTNRDIAQRQFVTPKNVEVHHSSANRKLGIG